MMKRDTSNRTLMSTEILHSEAEDKIRIRKPDKMAMISITGLVRHGHTHRIKEDNTAKPMRSMTINTTRLKINNHNKQNNRVSTRKIRKRRDEGG